MEILTPSANEHPALSTFDNLRNRLLLAAIDNAQQDVIERMWSSATALLVLDPSPSLLRPRVGFDLSHSATPGASVNRAI